MQGWNRTSINKIPIMLRLVQLLSNSEMAVLMVFGTFESTFYRLIRSSSGAQGAGYCVFDKFLGGIFARELQLNA
jgi:hypothetical protein